MNGPKHLKYFEGHPELRAKHEKLGFIEDDFSKADIKALVPFPVHIITFRKCIYRSILQFVAWGTDIWKLRKATQFDNIPEAHCTGTVGKLILKRLGVWKQVQPYIRTQERSFAFTIPNIIGGFERVVDVWGVAKRIHWDDSNLLRAHGFINLMMQNLIDQLKIIRTIKKYSATKACTAADVDIAWFYPHDEEPDFWYSALRNPNFAKDLDFAKKKRKRRRVIYGSRRRRAVVTKAVAAKGVTANAPRGLKLKAADADNIFTNGKNVILRTQRTSTNCREIYIIVNKAIRGAIRLAKCTEQLTRAEIKRKYRFSNTELNRIMGRRETMIEWIIRDKFEFVPPRALRENEIRRGGQWVILPGRSNPNRYLSDVVL